MTAPLRIAVFGLLPSALLLFFLFRPLRIGFSVSFRWQEDGFRILINIRHGLLRFRLRYKPVFISGRGLVFAAEKNGVLELPKLKPPEKKRKRKRILRAALPAVSLSRLRICGEIGVAEDAAVCCFLAGAAGVFLSGVIRTAAAVFFGGRASFSRRGTGGIRPAFFKNRFDIAFSGIAAAVPAKLIKNLLTAAVQERKKENDHAPDRKHHANLHGADQAYGGGRHRHRLPR